MVEAFFTTDDGEWFVPTDYARGPWDRHACHAGPPTGLLVRAMEQAVPDKRLTRITVELIRPVPVAGFSINATVAHEGRSVATLRAEIIDSDGRVRATASGTALAPTEMQTYPTINEKFGSPSEGTDLGFPIRRSAHSQVGFAQGVELRYAPGSGPEPGPTVFWMRTVPLLPSEEASPFQRICPLADSANAFGRNAEPWEVAFMNADLTVELHREPSSEWLGMSARSYWEPDGIGMSDALLFDESGLVGRALQTLLLRPGTEWADA